MLQEMPPELKRMVIVQVYNSRCHADKCEDIERGRIFADEMKVGVIQRRLNSSVNLRTGAFDFTSAKFFLRIPIRKRKRRIKLTLINGKMSRDDLRVTCYPESILYSGSYISSS